MNRRGFLSLPALFILPSISQKASVTWITPTELQVRWMRCTDRIQSYVGYGSGIGFSTMLCCQALRHRDSVILHRDPEAYSRYDRANLPNPKILRLQDLMKSNRRYDYIGVEYELKDEQLASVASKLKPKGILQMKSCRITSVKGVTVYISSLFMNNFVYAKKANSRSRNPDYES